MTYGIGSGEASEKRRYTLQLQPRVCLLSDGAAVGRSQPVPSRPCTHSCALAPQGLVLNAFRKVRSIRQPLQHTTVYTLCT